MNFLAHLIFGVLLFTGLLYFIGYFSDNTNIYKLFVAYIILLTSSLVPDLDHRKSIIFQVFNVIIGILLFIWIVTTYGINLENMGIFLLVYILWYLLISKIILGKHRGFLHSLSFLIIFTVIIFLSTRSLLFTSAAFTGFLSHLLLDRCIKLW